ncbi:MAG: CPBP family glutamic-type intramembrane protease [Candidatus Omnitrophota bacterium]
MPIKLKIWITFLVCAILSAAVWYALSYPEFSFVELAIDRKEATNIAKAFLTDKRGIDPSAFQDVAVFTGDHAADQYLQKTLGIKKEREFLAQHDFDLFLWVVRFFRENEKEEYRLSVSASTGEITSFKHIIADTDKREDISQDQARLIASNFLKTTFPFNPEDYTQQAQQASKLENRTNYSFNWEKKDVRIPWSQEPESGNAKLLRGATVSGDEVLSFYKNQLQIPEKYNRTLAKQRTVGDNISIVFHVLYVVILTAGTFFVIARRNHLAMHKAKNFMIGLAVVLFALSLLDYANEPQNILFHYPTTSSMTSYLYRMISTIILVTFYVTIAILMPGLSGESLHHEMLPEKKRGSFLFYINSTFFSNRIFSLVTLGYLTFIIMLGIQSIAFHFGRQYLGVWTERAWMTQLSSSALPFLAAFIIGVKASFIEEITFRIFAISWIRKISKSLLVAVAVSSIIWGFGHSHYPVFPMWFRGIEVTLLGLLLSYVYLTYGIIPVLVAHYSFDVFWCGSNMLFGKVSPLNFYSVLFVLSLPLIYGILSALINKPEKENPMRWKFNKHQIYNLGVLKAYLNQSKMETNQTPQEIREELITHNWDVAVVEEALRDNKRDESP